MHEGLAAEIETLDVPLDGDALAELLGLQDRLEARVAEVIGAFDAAGLWELDGATSMTAWLAERGGLVRRRAAAVAGRARRLASLPVTLGAWREGVLSGGQVEAIAANLDRDTVGLFAEHEAELIPTLAGLSTREVAVAMQTWREHATADRQPKPERPQELHLSQGLGSRWVLDGNLDAETGELLATALRLAESRDGDGEPTRTPGTRRADALADLCRFFLDHQNRAPSGSRNRPHLNLILDYDKLMAARAAAEALDGTVLGPESTLRLLCDINLRRIVMDGDSAVIDYGQATRTIPPPMWNALGIRDRHCRFPGCDRPAHWCEGHHVRPWLYGGPTSLMNLVMLCVRHHHVLHRPGWEAKLLPDGTLEVTDPNGRTRTTRPPGRTQALPHPA